MSADPIDLAALIDPVPMEGFFAAHWETKPLHLQARDARYYDRVLTIGDLENMIASPDARYPAIQLSKNGAYFPPEVYSQDLKFGEVRFTGVPDLHKIAAEYRAGATVVMPALHRTWKPLTDLCMSLESQLDHVVHANAYLTPGNASGFTPHYDTHEVLVLQVAGNKRWRVYEPPIALPHRRQPFTPVGYTLPAAPLLDVDLAPGDLLYLPRGHVHSTQTSASHSAHVTLGIAVYTWLDVAGELLQRGMESLRFRKALPPGFATRTELRAGLKEELASMLDDLRNDADDERLIELFLGRVRSNRPKPAAAFRSDVAVIGPRTLLNAPDPNHYRIGQQDGKATVEFQGRRWLLPSEARTALDAIRERRVFHPDDLPGPLDAEGKLALVRSLHERGFLSRCEEQ